jgi:hypothetical protein
VCVFVCVCVCVCGRAYCWQYIVLSLPTAGGILF